MNNVKFIETLVQQYRPQLPFDQLVIEMNRIYHRFEAGIYDRQHPEIYEQLPPIWKEMSKKITEYFGLKVLRILDFGCGTGFEAQQLLQNIPVSNIAALTCYDPSPEMLEKCRTKITPLYPDAMFCSSLEEALTSNAPYTLLLTNSVLHHLPDVPSTIRNLLPLLDSNAMWLAGHEPSVRFYKNIECVTNLKAFEAYLQKRWRPHSNLYQLLKRIIRRESNLYTKTAQELVRMGLFKRQPPAEVIDRIVDFHVAHSTEEISVGRGFDFSALQQDFQASWKLVWSKTYSFMGPFYERRRKGRWADSCQELARRFPNDGANFCTIWQKV
jgi:SAM-dependent methyltransferase